MKMATRRAGAFKKPVFPDLVHEDHLAVRRGDDQPRLRRDGPLRVPEKVSEKAAPRSPGPSARTSRHQAQENQQHAAQNKGVAGSGDKPTSLPADGP